MKGQKKKKMGGEKRQSVSWNSQEAKGIEVPCAHTTVDQMRQMDRVK